MDLSLKTLEEAVGIRRQISNLEKRLSSLFGSSTPRLSPGKRRRRMSAATRAKIAAAARARWAKRRSTKVAGKRTGITPAGRRKLSQLMKARWAARKKAGRRK